jgi:hypothetical protein
MEQKGKALTWAFNHFFIQLKIFESETTNIKKGLQIRSFCLPIVTLYFLLLEFNYLIHTF